MPYCCCYPGHSINNEEVSRSAPQNGSIFNEIITGIRFNMCRYFSCAHELCFSSSEASEATVTSNAQKQQQAPNDESNSSTDHESSDDEGMLFFTALKKVIITPQKLNIFFLNPQEVSITISLCLGLPDRANPVITFSLQV